MTAAAYARDLLLRLVPAKVADHETIRDMLKLQAELADGFATIRRAASLHHHNLSTFTRRHERSDYFSWSGFSDPSTNYNKAREDHYQGTGQWLLGHPDFSAWSAAPGGLFWLCGGPGFGKSILSSVVIDWLHGRSNGDPHIAYFFFHFPDSAKQSLEDALRSLIAQLSVMADGMMKRLAKLWKQCHEGTRQPSLKDLQSTLMDMLREGHETWIILDALDECAHRDDSTVGVLPWIRATMETNTCVHIFATSRREYDIVQFFNSRFCPQHELHLGQEHLEKDIAAYVRGKVANSDAFLRWKETPEIQTDIVDRLVAKADNMHV
ncbi:Hypothetical protein D9617_7g031010 [Elsinoe fawcettii]|nr:Hypothetical protein D9617_7g031010 [Elsinoe fawcettii]